VEIRLDAHKYINVLRRPISERAQDIGAWYSVLAIVSQLAVVTNAILIAITSNFVGFEVYIRAGYDDQYRGVDLDLVPNEEAARQGLSGYANWSTTSYEVDVLVDGSAFPAFTAQSLKFVNDDGSAVEVVDGPGGDGNLPLYLPFINFTCIEEMAEDNDCDMAVLSNISITTYDGNENETTFAADEYAKFYGKRECRDLVFNMGDTSASPGNSSKGPCYDGETPCRFRGIVREQRPISYWHTWTARLAFIILFEHFIFILSGVLAWLIPDVPQSVKNEIQKEKLLAFEAIHARHDAGKQLGVKEGGGPPAEDAS
jgi:hypothetical protein